jgi:hypothetical protein
MRLLVYSGWRRSVVSTWSVNWSARYLKGFRTLLTLSGIVQELLDTIEFFHLLFFFKVSICSILATYESGSDLQKEADHILQIVQKKHAALKSIEKQF